MTTFKIIPDTTQNVKAKVTSTTQSAQIGIVGFGGPTGPGVASGGTTGQVLSKNSNDNYDTVWVDQLSQENIQDYVAPLFVHNNHTNASVTYEDALNQIHIDVTNAPSAGYTSQVKHQVKLAEPISKGQAVYVSSSNGTNMLVSKASNATEGTSSKTMGLLETGGTTNDFVNVITEGLVSGLDTSTANAGDPVWLGTSGNLIFGLVNKPYAPAHLVFLGIVTRKNQNNGEIFVKVQNGFELSELHTVDILSSLPVSNDLLAYDSATSLWKNKSFSTLGLATTSYVDTSISNLIGGASSALDTLNELATALGNDASFATTVTNSLAGKANLTGGNSFTGNQIITASGTGVPALEVKPVAGATVNTVNFYNTSGVVISGVRRDGLLMGQIQSPTIYQALITPNSATGVPLITKGFALQSANLQEWQDSSGTVLSSISSTGIFRGQLSDNVQVGSFTTQPYAATQVPLKVKGYTSQTANLQEWQMSDGSVRSAMSAFGNLLIRTTGGFGGSLEVGTFSTTTIGIVVRGVASQTANLQEWQISDGTVRMYVNQAGNFFTNGSANFANGFIAYPSAASNVVATVKGAVSQSANLQEWQDSSGTVLSNITSAGYLVTNGPIQTTGIRNPSVITVLSFNSSGINILANNPTASNTGLVVRGAASQTADIVQIQDSSANNLLTIRPNLAGNWTNDVLVANGPVQISPTASGTGYGLFVKTGTSSSAGVMVRGAASQSANLQEWQDSSGSLLASVSSVGGFNTNSANGYQIAGAAGFKSLNLGQTALITAGSSVGANPHIVIRQSASQTGNLLEWQDSGSGVVASMSPAGRLYTIGRISTLDTNFTGFWTLNNNSTNSISLLLKTTSPSNSSDLIQVQNSTSTVAGINSNGQIYTGSLSPIIGYTFALTAASASSTTVATYTYNSTSQLIAAGQSITISGFTTETYFNGTFIVTAIGGVSGAYTFTVAGSGFTVASATQFGTFNVPSQMSITMTSPTTQGLRIKGIANQQTSYLEVIDSSNGVRALINQFGNTQLNNGLQVVGALGTAPNSTGLLVNSNGASNRVIIARGSPSQSVNIQEWQDSSANVMARIDQNGAFWGKSSGIIGYSTTSSASTFVGQWTKFAMLTMSTQYVNTAAIIDFSSDGPGNTDIAHGRLFVSFKQQQVMGTSPEPPTMFLYNGYNATINDFAAVLTQNDATATRFELYVRNNNSFQVIKFNPTIVTDSNNFTFYENQSYLTNLPAGVGITVNTVNPPETDVIPIDNISNYFNGVTNRFQITYQGTAVTVKNPFRLMVNINGVPQTVNTPEYAWQSPIPYDGFFVDNDSFINFSESPQPGTIFDGRIMAGAAVSTRVTNYPFRASDLLLGA